MLQPQELRIGNLVKNLTGKEIEIESIGYSGINYSSDIHGYSPDYNYESLTGILLSESILLRFGFSQTNYIDVYAIQKDGRGYHIVNYGNNLWVVDTRYKIHYLHELQNLIYVLSGEELEDTSRFL